jgi:hypothetical protein
MVAVQSGFEYILLEIKIVSMTGRRSWGPRRHPAAPEQTGIIIFSAIHTGIRFAGNKLNSPTAMRAFAAFLFIALLAYFAYRIWLQKRNQAIKDEGIEFRPKIGFTRLDGGASLAVLLDNRSDRTVWAEEIEIVLTNLIAKDQTSEASCHEIQKIHQNVRGQDMLPVSLVGTIYKAAGNPQRKYSCLMSSILRYKVGEKMFEKPLAPHTLRMAGLTIVSERRERWTKSEFKPAEKARDPQMAGTKSK